MKRIMMFLLICLSLTACDLTQFMGESVEVTFVYDNGEEDLIKKVSVGSTVEAPDDPIKDGYAFAGWYHNGKRWSFRLDTVEEKMTLTAKWDLNTKKIVYDYGYDNKTEEVVFSRGELITLPTNLKRDGYLFTGWFINDVLWNNRYREVYTDLHFEAHWIELNDEVVVKNAIKNYYFIKNLNLLNNDSVYLQTWIECNFGKAPYTSSNVSGGLGSDILVDIEWDTSELLEYGELDKNRLTITSEEKATVKLYATYSYGEYREEVVYTFELN